MMSPQSRPSWKSSSPSFPRSSVFVKPRFLSSCISSLRHKRFLLIVLAVGLICRGLVLGTTKSKSSRLFSLFCKHPGLFVSIHCCCMSSVRSLKYMLNVLSRALFCFANFFSLSSEALSSASGSDSATTTAVSSASESLSDDVSGNLFFRCFRSDGCGFTTTGGLRFGAIPASLCSSQRYNDKCRAHCKKAVTVHCTTSIQDNMNIFTAELARDLNRSAKTCMYSAQKMHPKFIAHSVAPPAHRHHRDSSPWQRIRAYSYHRSTNCPPLTLAPPVRQ